MFKNEVIVNFQDQYNNFTTTLNNLSGYIKNTPILTLPYDYNKIDTALTNFKLRYLIKYLY